MDKAIFDLAVNHGIFAVLFIAMLYWGNKKITENEKKSEERESRLTTKIDNMEIRYIEREDKYQEIVKSLSNQLDNKINTMEQDIKIIKEEIIKK